MSVFSSRFEPHKAKSMSDICLFLNEYKKACCKTLIYIAVLYRKIKDHTGLGLALIWLLNTYENSNSKRGHDVIRNKLASQHI